MHLRSLQLGWGSKYQYDIVLCAQFQEKPYKNKCCRNFRSVCMCVCIYIHVLFLKPSKYLYKETHGSFFFYYFQNLIYSVLHKIFS